ILAFNEPTHTLYRGPSYQSDSMVAVASDANSVGYGSHTSISISADGSKFAYLRATANHLDGPAFWPQVYISAGDSSGYASLPPSPHVADGPALFALMSDDASVV